MIRFLHTGDLHLGLKFTNASFPRARAAERRMELWQTFERIVEYAKNHKIDFLLIAGDLFETDYFTINDIRRVRDTFRQAPEVRILIAAGNHDYRGARSLYNRIDWTDNVSIFEGGGIQHKEFPDLDTVVYGYSWDAIQVEEDFLLEALSGKIDKDKNNILLLHGDISPSSSYLPLGLEDLRALNMDYIGLGHIHKPEILARNIAYCGSPEPLDFGESGPRGIILGSIEKKEVEIEFLPFSKRVFKLLDLDLDETMGYPDIVNRIRNLDGEERGRDFYRVSLNGFIHREINLDGIEEDLLGDFYHIEIVNNTKKDYDLEGLVRDNEDNIIGQFIRSMQEKDLEEALVRQALYYGLEVLLRGE